MKMRIQVTRLLLQISHLQLVAGMIISFASLTTSTTTTSTLAPETTSVGPVCPTYNSRYNDSELILDIVEGECELIVRPHDPSLFKGLSQIFGKRMKKLSKKIQYPDIEFRAINILSVGDANIKDASNACAMPYRHRGPFIVIDYIENCQMIIGIQRKRMPKSPRKESQKERKPKLSKQERRKQKMQRKLAQRATFTPVVHYSTERIL